MYREIIKVENESKNHKPNHAIDPVEAIISELRNAYPEEDTSGMEAGLKIAFSYDHNHKLAPKASTNFSQRVNAAVEDLAKDPQKVIRKEERLNQIISKNSSLKRNVSILDQRLASSSAYNNEVNKKVQQLLQANDQLKRTNNNQKLIIGGSAVILSLIILNKAFGNKNSKKK